MAVVSRIATVRVTTVLGAYREWVATATVQDYAAGTTQNIVVTSTTSGAVPPIVEDTLALDVYADDGQTLIRNYSLTAGSASQTISLYMTANGQSGGTSVADTFRLRLRAIKTTGLGTDTYNVNSDNGSYGSPASTPMTGGSASATSAGYVRGTTTATGTVSNASYGGAKPNPFAYNDQVFLRYVFGAQPAISRTNTITFGPLSAAVASTTTTFQNTFGTSGTGTLIANNWTIGLTSNQATGITIANAGLTGSPYVVISTTTPDTSGNGRTGALVGSVLPTVVTTPLAGMQFDGVDRDALTSGVDCGVTGFAVSTSDGSMRIKATIRRSRTGIIEAIAGRAGTATPASVNYLLYIDASGKLVFAMVNSSALVVSAVGTTSLAIGTNYNVEGNWTGTVLDVKIAGVQEGTTPALTALQVPDSTTPLMIGRDGDLNAGQPPYPFQGIISNVEMYRGGVLQGQYALTSVTTGEDTANVDPRGTIGQHAQGASSTRSGGSDKTAYVISADQLFVWPQALNARGEIISGWTMTQQLLASDATTVLVQNTTQVTQAADGWTPNPGVDFTSFVSAPSGNRTQKSFPNAPSNAVGLGTATRLLGFSSAFTANRGMNIVIPDEAGIGIQQTINFEYLQSDGTRVTLDSAPSVRVYSLNGSGVQVDDLALTTMTQYSGQQCWSKAWTPATAGTYTVEVRAPVAGAIIEGACSITVRPKYTKAVAGIVGIL